MGLPKHWIAKLKPLLKEGAELPDEFDNAVGFDSDEAFVAAAHAKLKTKLTDAEKQAAKAAKEAGDAQMASLLERIGIKDPDKVEEFIASHNHATGKLTETEKQLGELSKQVKDLSKENKTLKEDNDGLKGFRTTVLKTNALTPHLAKIHPDFRPMVSKLVLADLVIGEKDAVTAPEGKAIDAHIDELIKATPSLKAPDFKQGAGTGPNGGKAKDDGNGAAPTNGASTQEFPKDLAGGLAAIMREKSAPPANQGNV